MTSPLPHSPAHSSLTRFLTCPGDLRGQPSTGELLKIISIYMAVLGCRRVPACGCRPAGESWDMNFYALNLSLYLGPYYAP